MSEAKLIEAMANSLIAYSNYAGIDLLREEAHALVRAALSAAAEAGYAIVPREPTEAMHEAANREWDGRMSARSAGVWQAMLAASEHERK